MRFADRRLCLALVLVDVGACKPAAPVQARVSSDPNVQAAVLKTFDSLASAIRALNIDRMLQFYTTDNSVVRVIDGRLIAGRSAVERDFRDGFAAVRSMNRIQVVARHAAVLGPEAAVLTIQLDEAFTDTSGHETALRATWTSAWRLEAGHWRIVQDAAIHAPAGR